ncbi:MAG: tRNA lysidine(34) synthetase TilS [Clostridium sp.]|nr:tRNA lysidine(34) synthetase TilS [Clostridium sp.]MCM1171763.1 tRNA lysidine(34) synthetase TilS [Clostridium sp.]MCM1207961.1 tRNA lysidine(34) synthetase TilS [Ruminococcus sp.]
MDKFILNVKKYIEENHMLENAEGMVVGLSGGPDSVCLLRVMCELADCFGIGKNRIYCVHINHGIRGEEADADEKFAEQLCGVLGVPFVCFQKDITAYAGELGCSVEEAGRRYRYDCFRQVMKENHMNRLAVAHNKNDVVETFIFNMLRGSGIRGMAGIRPVRDDVIRPLLFCHRAEIEQYLADIGQDYRTDSTNLSIDYDRNRIRHIILPELVKMNANAIEHIYSLAAEAEKVYGYVHEKAAADMENVISEEPSGRGVKLDINKLEVCDDVIKEHMLHEAAARVAGSRKDISRKHILAVLALCRADTGKQVMLPYGICARRSYDNIIITKSCDAKEGYSVDIDGSGCYEISDVGTFSVSVEPWKAGMEVSKKIYTKMVDYGKIKGNICIRTPEFGDYIIIDGKGSSKKLSRLFIDKKIDRIKRLTWPVIACGNEIIWVVGLRYSEAYKVDENTYKVMCINFKGKGE